MELRRLLNLKSHFGNRAIVLMYHRIAPATNDLWELNVSLENFEQQLQVLRETCHVIPMLDLVQQVKQGRVKHNTVAVTFDDGYIDNYQAAKPLLEKYNIPATFFITTGNLGLAKEFWWDELERIVFQTDQLPQKLRLKSLDQCYEFCSSDDTVSTDTFTMEEEGQGSSRHAFVQRERLYRLLWQRLQQLDAAAQQNTLAELRSWAGLNEEARVAYQCMSIQQVQDLAHNTLFTIGGHTVTHPALDKMEAEVQRREIIDCNHALEDITSKKIALFSYPYGIQSQFTQAILNEEGIEAAVTTDHYVITKSTNLYRMSRFQVNNWPGSLFEQRVTQWLKRF